MVLTQGECAFRGVHISFAATGSGKAVVTESCLRMSSAPRLDLV